MYNYLNMTQAMQSLVKNSIKLFELKIMLNLKIRICNKITKLKVLN